MKQLSLIPIIIILMQSIGWGSVPAATSAPAATPTPAVSAPHVIGGDPSSDVTSIGGYAGIRVTYTKNGVAAAGFCNGVLVDSEWVLTAAYCMYPAGVNITSQPANVRVELGCFRNLNNVCSSGTLMLYGQPRQPAIVARQIVVHDQMTVVDGIPQPAYGVALIRLSTPAQTGAGVSVWTVAQSSNNPTAESSPYIVSYGNKGLKATATATRTQTASRTPLIPSRTPTNITRTATQTRTSTATAWPEGIATSDVLKASIALINDSSCTLPGFSGATLWCANATAQGNELCYGDTGAPLVSKVSGQLAVFGISLPKVQFGGAHNCVMGMQSAMVDVTAPAIRTWIVNTIRATSPRGLNTSLGGSAGFGGEQIAPSDNDMTQVDVSSVFPSGIRIGTTVTNIVSVNANGVVALGDVKKLDKVINPATYTGAPLFLVYGADADPSLGAITASVGGKSSGANRVWVSKDVVNGVVTITWDDVRPAKLFATQYIGNTFQVQFRRENTSDVRVTYRYGMLQWTFSETMCSQFACMGGGNRVTYAQVGYVSGQARGAGNLIHTNSGNDAKLRALVSHEYVVRDGIVGPERPTATSSSTRTMTRTSTPTRTQTPTRTMTASMTPTASRTSQRTNALFGTGRDGVYTVNAGQVVTFPQLYLTPTADVIYAGNAFITFASDISGLRVGDELLIVQMKAGSDLAYAGRNEFVTVKTIDTVAKRITLDTALLNTYQPTLEGAVVQVVQVKHFTNVTINGELQPASWNGTTGGLMAFRVSGALTGVGRIEASGRGYRGGAGGRFRLDPVGLMGESYTNWVNTPGDTRRNASGGGGAYGDTDGYFVQHCNAGVRACGGGGGGGAGNINDGGNGGGGVGGPAGGQAGGAKGGLNAGILIGSGGGGGGNDNGDTAHGGNGGNGGGGVYIAANSIALPWIAVNAQNGEGVSGSRRGGGGGGAGGWVQVIGGTITQLDAINANGGTGGVGSGDSSKGYGGTGGNGDYGTVLVQYCTSTVAIGGTTKTVQQIPCTGTSESTWAFNTLSGDSSASSTLANTNTTFFCGTNYHATMICPAVSSENGTIFVRFTGTQFMGSQAAISETSNVIRIRLRTSQANDGKVGIYGVVKNFNADSYEAFDRELFFDRGKVCSRLFQGPTDIICTTSRYDDGQWHLIERSYGGSTPAHRLRVDNEVVTGQYTFSAFNWKNGAIIGNSGMFELLTKFRGDIDYVSTGLAP